MLLTRYHIHSHLGSWERFRQPPSTTNTARCIPAHHHPPPTTTHHHLPPFTPTSRKPGEASRTPRTTRPTRRRVLWLLAQPASRRRFFPSSPSSSSPYSTIPSFHFSCLDSSAPGILRYQRRLSSSTALSSCLFCMAHLGLESLLTSKQLSAKRGCSRVQDGSGSCGKMHVCSGVSFCAHDFFG